MEWLLDVMPSTRHLHDPEVLDRFLPWSADVPENCFPPKGKKPIPQKSE
ncbi:MAG: hypothetical protein LUB61_03390 [Eggerthellaceae bacterium]|nr:hypothetical protein [Eggerthellaceae bacterium]